MIYLIFGIIFILVLGLIALMFVRLAAAQLSFHYTPASLVDQSDIASSQDWLWDRIDTDDIVFPKNFLWGTAWSEYQSSGATLCKDSNWAGWEKQGNIKNKQRSGVVCDHWNNVARDVACIKQLGLNAARFSIEWSVIEPQNGVWNADAIMHYSDEINTMIAANIKPMITLHHFSLPRWFEEKGGFEIEENIEYFTRFAIKIFNEFSDRVSLWCTINEPGIYAFQSYVRGVYPPGVIDSQLAGKVLKNLLQAHTRVYKALKLLRNGLKSQIGIVHQYLLFRPFHKDNWVETKVADYLTNLTGSSVLAFFKTGLFSYRSNPLFDLFAFGASGRIGLGSSVHYSDPDAAKTLDFIGLNYYSRVLFNWKKPLLPAYRPEDIVTDMYYALYPEGLYHAITDVAMLDKPIYITENGVADATDAKRAIFFKRYLYALSRALQKGYDVRGYFYWSLMDNFEWDEGSDMKFGLYALDPVFKNPMLKNSAYVYASVIAKSIGIEQYEMINQPIALNHNQSTTI